MMLSSIRARLTLWYVGVLALVFTAFAMATYSLFLRVLQDETRTNLNEMASNFVTSVNQLQSEKPHRSSPSQLVAEVLAEFNFRDYHFAVFTSEDLLIGKTIEADLPSGLTSDIGENKFARMTIGNETYSVTERPFRAEGRAFKLFVFFPLADQEAIESRIKNIFLIVAPILLLLAGLGGYLLARQSLKPIALMGERAKHIGAANLHERLPIANPNDEIGDLALQFNQLLDRLDRAFEAQRRFMADASHELRTPLAIVRGESEVALQRDQRTDGEYRESLRIVNDEGKRLSKIVEDLFTLARVDSGDIKASFREVYIDEIVEACVRKIRTLADKRNITVEFRGNELKVPGDEALLQRLFLNLLDNAVKYNFDNGRVSVEISGRNVAVRNTGPEIPEDQNELIFERFYRIDKAHSRQADTFTSGAGLGLSIAKWIANIHQAELALSRSDSGENIFSVTFGR